MKDSMLFNEVSAAVERWGDDVMSGSTGLNEDDILEGVWEFINMPFIYEVLGYYMDSNFFEYWKEACGDMNDNVFEETVLMFRERLDREISDWSWYSVK